MNSAIITGATGFIGSHLCKYLLDNKWSINVIARKKSDFTNLEGISDNINILKYDGDIDRLIDFFKQTNADVVFHLASCIINEHKAADVDKLIDSNIGLGAHILEAMKQSETKLIVNTGTYWQHYESDDYNPVNLYAATKEALEKIIVHYAQVEGIRAVNLKLFDVYGEGDRRLKLLNKLDQIESTQEEFKLSPGEQQMEFVHVDDVVRAYECAYEYLKQNSDAKVSEFGVGSKRLMTLKDIADVFEQVYAAKLNIVWGGLEYRKRQIMTPWQNYKTLPNWECKVDLQTGLLRMKNHKTNL